MTSKENLKIGIPNRSSLLHVGAMSQIIAAGFIDLSEYHPAKLFYGKDETAIYLTSGQNLCTLLNKGILDIIFTGDDYVNEFLNESVSSLPMPFMLSRLALLGQHPNLPAPVEVVYTKYINTAQQKLKEWDINYERIEPISGGSEAFCFLPGRNVVFDVVSTGITLEQNALHAYRFSEPHGASWFSYQEAMPQKIQHVVSDNDLLASLIQTYLRLLKIRDYIPEREIAITLNSKIVTSENV